MRSVSAVLFVFATIGAGATLAEFRLIGWSGSGDFLAWEQFGWCDGTGLPWAELTILRTSDGSVVYHADSFPREETGLPDVFGDEENPLGAIHAINAEQVLDSLGIVPGNSGRLLIHHPITDFQPDPHAVGFYGWAMSVDYNGPEFLLELEETESGVEQEPDWFPQPVLLRLTLNRVYGEDLTLASDTALVQRYRQVFGYRIRDVYMYGNGFIAVVLNTVIPGFEGADGRFRVVAGALPVNRI